MCGDFDTGSSNISAHCTWNQLTNGNDITYGVGLGGNLCTLQPNTDYYLNLIFSPLTSPASAVFNGLNAPSVVLFQSFTFP